jgi:hypothetical protein
MDNKNWVEVRANRESTLWQKAPELWQEVRSAVQDACQSYNDHYSNPDHPEVICKLENGKRVRVNREAHGMVLIEFDARKPSIRYTRDHSESSGELGFCSDEVEAWIATGDGARMTPDAASRNLLEPLLFQTGEAGHPHFLTLM